MGLCEGALYWGGRENRGAAATGKHNKVGTSFGKWRRRAGRRRHAAAGRGGALPAALRTAGPRCRPRQISLTPIFNGFCCPHPWSPCTNQRQRYLDCTCPWTVICRAGQLNQVRNRNGMFAVPTVPAGVSTPTVPPAGCCAHTRGELARRFPSPRSCALTPTFLQVLATELPRPHPTPIPIARALLAAQLSLSRSTLSLNSRRTRTHTRTLPLSQHAVTPSRSPPHL